MHDIDIMLDLQLHGKHEEARAISDKLQQLGPEQVPDTKGNLGNPDIWLRHSFNRGWFLLQEGDYQGGSQLLENGRYLNVYGGGLLRTDAPIYNPQEHDIKDKSIIISLEGGYGDEIIHSRFATSFKKLGAKNVYLAAAPEMISLFSRIEGVDKVILRNQASTVAHDYWCPGFSAGWLTGHTFDTISGDPFLSAKPDSIEIWKSIINSDKIKVGIRWAGNPKFEHQQFRRFPENFITNLAKYPEFQVYSLQRDHNLIALPEGVMDLQYLLISWEDTAAAIMNLDIVITSCTSVAHLAAALGKETWIVVPVLPYHTWTYGTPTSTTSPYYNSVRLYRQSEYGKWNDTFQRLYSDLETKFNLAHIDMPNEDKEAKRINLGCGLAKHKEFLNVDISEQAKPDQVVDLNVFPWPWPDNEFRHVVAENVLQYLGDSKQDFIKVIKEMYRISENGAIWELVIPHWRSDIILNDPKIKNVITPGTFDWYNKRLTFDAVNYRTTPASIGGFEENIDIEVCDVQYEYAPHWKQRLDNREATQEEMLYAVNTFNNVAHTVRILIQIYKPGRFDWKDIENILSKQ